MHLIWKAAACVMKWVEGYALSQSNRIFLLSDYSTRQVLRIHKIPEEKITKLRPGVEKEKFRLGMESEGRGENKASIPEDKIVFLTVRNLVPRMGIDHLIEAFANSRLLKGYAVLLVVGSGSMGNMLKKIVAKNRLQKIVKLVGRVHDEDLPKFYRSADFFVLPTEALEGFGLVILESLASGTPVIGTPIGAIPEVIGKFDPNFLLDGADAESIRRKLEHILKNRDAYYKSPIECRNFILKNFTWEKMATEFEAAMGCMT